VINELFKGVVRNLRDVGKIILHHLRPHELLLVQGRRKGKATDSTTLDFQNKGLQNFGTVLIKFNIRAICYSTFPDTEGT